GIRLDPAEQDRRLARRLARGQRFERGPEGAGHVRREAVMPAPLDRSREFVVEVLRVEARRGEPGDLAPAGGRVGLFRGQVTPGQYAQRPADGLGRGAGQRGELT